MVAEAPARTPLWSGAHGGRGGPELVAARSRGRRLRRLGQLGWRPRDPTRRSQASCRRWPTSSGRVPTQQALAGVGQAPGDRLADPPGGVGPEDEGGALLDGLDEAEVAVLESRTGRGHVRLATTSGGRPAPAAGWPGRGGDERCLAGLLDVESTSRARPRLLEVAAEQLVVPSPPPWSVKRDGPQTVARPTPSRRRRPRCRPCQDRPPTAASKAASATSVKPCRLRKW